MIDLTSIITEFCLCLPVCWSGTIFCDVSPSASSLSADWAFCLFFAGLEHFIVATVVQLLASVLGV